MRWTDERNQERGSLGRRTDRIWLRRASGSCASRRGPIRANGLPRAAAHCCMVFGRRCQLGARAVGAAKSLSGLGVVRSGRRPARASWFSRSAARQRRVSRRSGTVDVPGLSTACAIIRASVSVTRVVGLVSNGVLRSPASVAAVGSVAIAPLDGYFETPWPRRAVVSRRTHADIRVTRSVRRERPERFPCHGSGFATVGVTTRRLAGRSKVRALSNVVVGDRSFERPSNTQMEPSRPTVRCYPAADGARLICNVIRAEQERLRIVFHRGRLRPLVASCGAWLLRRGRATRGGRGKRGRSDLGRGNERRRAHRAAANGGVIRIR